MKQKQIINWTHRAPNATIHIIQNAGHLCNIEKPTSSTGFACNTFKPKSPPMHPKGEKTGSRSKTKQPPSKTATNQHGPKNG